MDDQQLLQQFLSTGSQAAFASLVHRHVNVVYASALRQVRNRHVAEDVTQAVFIVLHRKAHKLRNMPTLGGWLLKVTRFAAVDAMRRQARQDRHERAAARPESVVPAPATEDWTEVAPVLDEALAKLSAGDRDAIVLRYMEDATFPEVGQKLGLSEHAARKRVGRALLKLRGLLARKGVAMSVGGLAGMIVSHGAVAAPTHVAANAAAVVAAGSTSAASASLATGAIAAMSHLKAKLLVGAVAALLTVGLGTAVMQLSARAPAPAAQPVAQLSLLRPALDTPQKIQGVWHLESVASEQGQRIALMIGDGDTIRAAGNGAADVQAWLLDTDLDPHYLAMLTYDLPAPLIDDAEEADACNELRPVSGWSLTISRDELIIRHVDHPHVAVMSYGLDTDRQPNYIGLAPRTGASSFEGHCELLNENRLRLTLWDAEATQRNPNAAAAPSVVIHLHRASPRLEHYVYEFVVSDHGSNSPCLFDLDTFKLLRAPEQMPDDPTAWLELVTNDHPNLLADFSGRLEPGFSGFIASDVEFARCSPALWGEVDPATFDGPWEQQLLSIAEDPAFPNGPATWYFRTFFRNDKNPVGMLRILRADSAAGSAVRLQVLRLDPEDVKRLAQSDAGVKQNQASHD
jgi:RNA polymerase sigma factor (sigma-70 family)